MDIIHRELASVNPAWNRILTFILASNKADTNKNLGHGYNTECCLTDHSGWWCRRSRHQHDEGHLNEPADGDNLSSHQLGHRSERPADVLYAATDWSCQTTSGTEVVLDEVDTAMRNHVDLPAMFSIMINFGRSKYYQFLLSMLDYLEEDHGCPAGYVWDPFASGCRKIYCNPEGKHHELVPEVCPPNENQTDSDFRMTYVMELDVIQLTVYIDAVNRNANVTDDALLFLIEDSFASVFASFVGISPQRISQENVSLVNQTTKQSVQSMAIDFWLTQAADGSNEPTIDSVVALLGSLIVQDQLFVVMDGVTVQLVGLHEQPVPSEMSSFSNWCRLFGLTRLSYIMLSVHIYI